MAKQVHAGHHSLWVCILLLYHSSTSLNLVPGTATRDDYNQPSYADQSFFEGLKRVAERILVWGGSYELIIDSIEPLAKKIQQAHPQTEIVIESEAAHEGFIFDLTLGYKEKSQATKLIENWILAI